MKHFEKIYIISCLFVLLSGCGTPDLTKPKVLELALQEAIELESLQRKRMYGMIMLFVDKSDEPFTGWVKSENNGTVSQLGYLQKGQREGMWMEWYSTGIKKSNIHWTNDQMSGVFHTWHENGKIRVTGQTTDGEVDGEWKEFYENGSLEAHSENKNGTLVNIEVFLFNGEKCERSEVVDGNGTFIDYDINGSALRSRTFENGIESDSQWFNQQKP